MPRSNRIRNNSIEVTMNETKDSIKDVVVKVVGPYECRKVSTVVVPNGFKAIVRFGGDRTHEVPIMSDCNRNLKDILRENYPKECRHLLRQDCRVTYVKTGFVEILWGTPNPISVNDNQRVGANGKALVKVENIKRTVVELLAPLNNKLTIANATDWLKDSLRGVVSQEIARLLKSRDGSINYIQADYEALRDSITKATQSDTHYLESYFYQAGFEIADIVVAAIVQL